MYALLHGLAANPALPSALLDRLIALADDELAGALARRTDLDRGRALALARRVGDAAAVSLAYEGRLAAADVDPAEWPEAALALLDRGAAPAAWARAFAGDPDPGRRERLAACPGLPPDVTERLARDPVPSVVAESAWLGPADMAARLAAHPHLSVRRAVAENDTTPPAVLASLLTGEGLPPARRCRVCAVEGETTGPVLPPGERCGGDHESAVVHLRESLLRNPATPPQAAARFADDPHPLLRWAVAGRADLSRDACVRLAADPLPLVRAALAENPALDGDLVRSLADDPDPEIRRAVARHPRVPLDVLVPLARTTALGTVLLPRIATASADETGELVASAEPAARRLVALRRDLPTGARDRLADDPDAKVAAAVAPHPGLSEARLRAMVVRHGRQVMAGVAANPDTPAALLEELARHQPPVRGALREIDRHRAVTPPALLVCLADARARPFAAGHPALPPAVLRGLLADADADEAVREAAAAHPSLPPTEMARLLPEP
ncbi:hypothetical protein HHL19_19270 [Streptomyces sp. R302]|uniref:hypothetical protein n=1 Tax=unclassified Streptomyces TaxID=2593676 RepID=UPI00145EDDB8|nr:hypothetical protein [Streptomyces sp. R301]NML80751.1 hypothetical protein [Streptomyces sp. R302]